MKRPPLPRSLIALSLAAMLALPALAAWGRCSAAERPACPLLAARHCAGMEDTAGAARTSLRRDLHGGRGDCCTAHAHPASTAASTAAAPQSAPDASAVAPALLTAAAARSPRPVENPPPPRATAIPLYTLQRSLLI